MKLEGMRVGILVGPLFEDLEFWAVYMRIKEEGARLTVIGSKAGEVFSSKSGGLSARAEVAASQVASSDLDALLVPGGFAPDKMRRDQDMLRLVKELHARQAPLGFICHAGWVAASAKIIHGRPVTGSLGIKDDLENAGGRWVDEPAFADGHLVWGRVVEDIPDYNRVLVQTLGQFRGR